MPFQPINFANIRPQGSPFLRDFIETLSQGMDLGRKPQALEQAAKQRDLANQLAQYQVAFEPERQKLQQSLMGAQIQKALQAPQPGMSNFEKAMQGAERIKQQYGPDSAEYKLSQQYLNRLAEGSGMSLQVDPKTGAITFSQGGGARGGQGMQMVDGKLVQRPTTPTMTRQQKGSVANVQRMETAKYIEHPYIGTGANKKLLADRLLYGQTKDPVKKKEIGERLVKAAVAAKLAPEYALQQLNAQDTQATIPAIHEQTKALKQGWPELMEQVVNNLPPELQAEAKRRHDEGIESMNKVRNKFIAQGMPIELEEPSKEEGVKKFDPVDYDAPAGSIGMYNDKGEMFFFPANQVKRRLAEGYRYEE